MTAFGPHQTRADVTAATLAAMYGPGFQPQRRQRDRTVNPGTLGLWDFASLYGCPGGYTPITGEIPPGTTMRNLVPGGTDAVRDTAYPDVMYAGGGIHFTGDASLLLTTVAWRAGLMLTIWMKAASAPTVGDNARLLKLGPIALTANPANPVIVGPGQLIGGLNADLATMLGDGVLHQLSIQSEVRPGGKHRMVIALDRIVLLEGPDADPAASGTVEIAIGARDGAGTIAGAFYRARLDDTTVAGVVADDVLRADYEANIVRLGALA